MWLGPLLDARRHKSHTESPANRTKTIQSNQSRGMRSSRPPSELMPSSVRAAYESFKAVMGGPKHAPDQGVPVRVDPPDSRCQTCGPDGNWRSCRTACSVRPSRWTSGGMAPLAAVPNELVEDGSGLVGISRSKEVAQTLFSSGNKMATSASGSAIFRSDHRRSMRLSSASLLPQSRPRPARNSESSRRPRCPTRCYRTRRKRGRARDATRSCSLRGTKERMKPSPVLRTLEASFIPRPPALDTSLWANDPCKSSLAREY